MTSLCPCCSGKDYATCCKPLHDGKGPANALQLMRSRYSAYACHLSDYIMATTHPENAQYLKDRVAWKRSISQFCLHSSFLKLEILDFQETAESATVTFTAYIRQGDRDATFTEKSFFEKLGLRWLYRSGQFVK